MLVVRGLKRELPSQASTSGLRYSDQVTEAVTSSEEALRALSARVASLDADLLKQDRVVAGVLDAARGLAAQPEEIKGRLDKADL